MKKEKEISSSEKTKQARFVWRKEDIEIKREKLKGKDKEKLEEKSEG